MVKSFYELGIFIPRGTKPYLKNALIKSFFL
nr:MAG TPA: hypothetical protein [Caudoviricetes sp.]